MLKLCVTVFLLHFSTSQVTDNYTLVLKGESQGGYYVTLDIGTPPQKIHLLVDTGSSNMAVLISPGLSETEGNFFNLSLSSTFRKQDKTVTMQYSKASWNGFLAVDKVCLHNDSVCGNFQFSCITSSKALFDNYTDWVGVLGMAYPSLSQPDKLITPFFDTFVRTYNLNDIFSISFQGPFLRDEIQHSENGKLLLGGISDELYSGDIMYTPIVKEGYYEIIVTNLKIGDTELHVPCIDLNLEKSIIDTGTSFLAFPPKIFALVIYEIRKQVKSIGNFSSGFWTKEDTACIEDADDLKHFPTIEISLYHSQSSSFSLLVSPNLYLLRLLKQNKKYCFVFTIGTSDDGSILGAAALKGFYVIFDRQNKRVGFANSTYTMNSDPLSIVTNAKPLNETLNIFNCKASDNFALNISLVVIFGIVSAYVSYRFIKPIFKKIVTSNQSNFVRMMN